MGWTRELGETLRSMNFGNKDLEDCIWAEDLHTDNLPSLPEVITEAMRILDEGGDIHDIEALLRNDPPLVAKMLRVVNAPWYRPAHEITSIHRAIVMLGLRGLRSLLMIAAIAERMDGDYSCYGYSPRGLQEHAIAVAAGARALAQYLQLDGLRQEEIFVAGLLHDIGKMLLAPHLRAAGTDVTLQEGSITETERWVLGLDHVIAGAILAEKWKLSPLVLAAILDHHGDHDLEDYRLETSIVGLADAHARDLGYGLCELSEQTYVSEYLLTTVGLCVEVWDDLQLEVEEEMKAGVSTLRNLRL